MSEYVNTSQAIAPTESGAKVMAQPRSSEMSAYRNPLIIGFWDSQKKMAEMYEAQTANYLMRTFFAEDPEDIRGLILSGGLSLLVIHPDISTEQRSAIMWNSLGFLPPILTLRSLCPIEVIIAAAKVGNQLPLYQNSSGTVVTSWKRPSAPVQYSMDAPVADYPLPVSQIITQYLHAFGIPASLLGYNYARKAIELCIENRGTDLCITKDVYPQIAKMYNSTPTRVERAMRHAIENVSVRADEELFNRVFPYYARSEHKPTNTEFIASVAELVLADTQQQP